MKKLDVIQKGDVTYTYEVDEQKTTTGLLVTAGEISNDFDKVDWKELLQDYTNMRNGGAVESTTVSILKYPILRAGYTIEHSDEEMKDYVQWVFDNLKDSFGGRQGFSEFLRHVLLALDYGCSFFEKVVERGVISNTGKTTNVIRRMAPFKPETIWEFHYDETMTFVGIKHERRNNKGVTDFIDIPSEKLFFYVHNAEYGDPRGRSELRPARNLYKIKKDILLATARAQQRGAGIPEIKSTKSGITDEEKKRLEAVGRSIGNMQNGYIITDADVEVKLHGLQIQGNPEHLLEYINREMFFNTLTEFMTSGIGQNGSRAATSEHKGSYELKYGVVTMDIESSINELIREIIDMSYFGPQTEYPTFKVNSLRAQDITAISDSIVKMYDKAILVKHDGDEEFIRSLFNMPEIQDNAQTVTSPEAIPEVEVEETVEVPSQDLKMLTFNKVLSTEDQLAFIQKHFDIDGTDKLYLDIQNEAQSIIAEVVQKYVYYIAKQFESGLKVEDKYLAELSNRLQKVYSKGFVAGRSAVEHEIELASNRQFATKPKDEKIKYTSESLKRFSGKLLYTVKAVTEDKLDTEWNPKRQSAKEYVETEQLVDGFKTDRRTLIDKVTDGYIEGRTDAINENKDKIDLYLYNSILDHNLCDNCAVLTGAVMTLEEAESMGFLTGKGRVNPNCKGGQSRCRCNLLIYKLRGDFV